MKIVKYLSLLLAIFLPIASGLVPHHRKGTSINYVVYLFGQFGISMLFTFTVSIYVRIDKQTHVLGSSWIWKCWILNKYLFWFFPLCSPVENNNKYLIFKIRQLRINELPRTSVLRENSWNSQLIYGCSKKWDKFGHKMSEQFQKKTWKLCHLKEEQC